MADVLAPLSLPDLAAFYRRLANSINSQFNNDSLAAQLLLHWLDGKGKLKNYKAAYVKGLDEVKDFLKNTARPIFLSLKTPPGGHLGGIVPRIKKAPGFEKAPGTDTNGPYPMHYEGNVEVGLGVQAQAAAGLAVDPRELDILYALHGFTLICDVVVSVQPLPNSTRCNVTFVKWTNKTHDDYHWDPSKYITVPNPDYNSKDPKAVTPAEKEVKVYHKNAKRLEDAGMAAPFIDESDAWDETDQTIVGPGHVDVGYLPALNPLAGATDSWTLRYGMVIAAYRNGITPYTEVFHILNGSSMPDILYILDQLASDIVLFQNLLPRVPGLGAAGQQRLAAAISAVRFTAQRGGSIGDTEFNSLPPDQQHDIEEFIALKTLLGNWRVRVDKWVWNYNFFEAALPRPALFASERQVRWTDPSNNETSLGTWTLARNMRLVTFAWAGSNSTEEWNMPINKQNQTGKTVIEGVTYSLAAVKIHA